MKGGKKKAMSEKPTKLKTPCRYRRRPCNASLIQNAKVMHDQDSRSMVVRKVRLVRVTARCKSDGRINGPG